MKHEIGDIWKVEDKWKIQFPKGIMTFKTKKKALLWQEQLKRDNMTHEDGLKTI